MRKQLILVLIFAGCTTPYSIGKYYDPYTKVQYLYENNNGYSEWYGHGIYLLMRYYPDSKQFAVKVVYDYYDWLFLAEYDSSIVFLVDGETIKLYADKVTRDTYVVGQATTPDVRIYETTVAFFTNDGLERILAAKELRCRLYGRDFFYDVDGSEMYKIREHWKSFVKEASGQTRY